MPKRKRNTEGEEPSIIQDLLDQLGRIHRQFPGSRLLVDLARDAGVEMARNLSRRIKRLKVRLERVEARRQNLQSRLADLLHELSNSNAALPVQEGQPPRDTEALVDRFRNLRDESYPALARVLHDLARPITRTAFVRFLAEDILYRSGPIIAEHQLRHTHRPWAAEAEQTFLNELRMHVAGKVNRSLARTAGLQVMPALGKHIDAIIGSSLEVLFGLMTASPQARLVVPSAGTPLDPQAHVVRHPDKAGEATVVGAVLFPGLVLLEATPRVVVPAIVHALPGKSQHPSGPLPAVAPPPSTAVETAE